MSPIVSWRRHGSADQTLKYFASGSIRSATSNSIIFARSSRLGRRRCDSFRQLHPDTVHVEVAAVRVGRERLVGEVASFGRIGFRLSEHDDVVAL
jgi:hypothetical protein